MGIVEKKNVQFIASQFQDPRFFYKIHQPFAVYSDEYFDPSNHMITFFVDDQFVVDFTHDKSEWFAFLTVGEVKSSVAIGEKLWGRLGVRYASLPGNVGERMWAFILIVKEFGIEEGMFAFEASRKV